MSVEQFNVEAVIERMRLTPLLADEMRSIFVVADKMGIELCDYLDIVAMSHYIIENSELIKMYGFRLADLNSFIRKGIIVDAEIKKDLKIMKRIY